MITENQPSYLRRHIRDYKGLMSADNYQLTIDAAKPLQGKTVIHLNSASHGGGVAEILKTLVPLEQSLGIHAKWFVLEGNPDFFTITKKMHNALQGGVHELTRNEQKYYLEFNRQIADDIQRLKPDLLIVHDPQPLALIQSLVGIPSVARIHIDLSTPQTAAINFVGPLLEQYDAVVFSAKQYVPLKLVFEEMFISPPAIDPLSPKNITLPVEECVQIAKTLGIDINRPLLVQIARFDPWKDPLGVITAYKIVKQKIPEVQLALAGVMEAKDDPEALDVLEEVKRKSEGDRDIHLFSELDNLKDIPIDTFVNALQRLGDVVFMKSLREGFGLVVAEGMWKEKAVVGGDATGIHMQIENGKSGFIVGSPEEAAQRALELLSDKNLAKAMGIAAHAVVRERFLLTRLLNDELQIMTSVLRP